MKRMALLACMGLLMANGDVEPGQPISPRFAGDPSPHWFDDRWYLYATDDASNSGRYWDSTSWRLYSSTDMKS